MISADPKYFLFIEPTSKRMEPDVNDDITEYFAKKFETMKPRSDFTKGFHMCKCKKAHSASNTFTISLAGKSYITNTLALHYIKNHRSEVPDTALDLIRTAMLYDANKALSKSLKSTVLNTVATPDMEM